MRSILSVLSIGLIITLSACRPETTGTDTKEEKAPVTTNTELTVVKQDSEFVVKRFTTSFSIAAPTDWDFGISPQKDRAVIGPPCDSGAMCPLFFIAINKDSTRASLAQHLNNLKQEIYLSADNVQIINESLDYTVNDKPAFLLNYTYVFNGDLISGTYVVVKHKNAEEINFSVLFPKVEGNNYKKYWEEVIVPVLKSVNIE